MKRSIILSCFLCLISSLSFASSFKIGGGAPPIEKVIEPNKAKIQETVGEIEIDKSGPGPAIKKLAYKKIDAAILIFPAEKVKKIATEFTPKVDTAHIHSVKITDDHVVFVVNERNQVKKLTPEQILQIFSGKLKNWKEVGGTDTPIHVIWTEQLKGVNILVKSKFFPNENLSENLKLVKTVSELKTELVNDPGAIAILGEFGAASLNGTAILAEPMVTTPVYVIINGISLEKIKFIDALQSAYRTKR